MENKPIIRKAEASDLEPLLGLLDQLKPNNKRYSQEDHTAAYKALLEITQNKDYFLKVCEIEGKLAGTAMLLVQMNLSHGGKPYGHIENVVTDQAYRGKGVGGLLVEDLLREAKTARCYKVILDCAESVSPFYQKFGFKKHGSIEMRIDLG